MAGNESVDYLYSAGGGVQFRWNCEEAILREVFEETGIEYEIDRLAYAHSWKNFYSGSAGVLEGLACHEIALYFLTWNPGAQ